MKCTDVWCTHIIGLLEHPASLRHCISMLYKYIEGGLRSSYSNNINLPKYPRV